MDSALTITLLVAGLVLLLAWGIYAALNAQRFFRELQYLNMEINRTVGSERKYWKRQRRKLWLSLLVFFRR